MFDGSLRSEPRLQRARGRVSVGFVQGRLRDLAQAGCGRVLLPNPYGGDPLAVVLNTAGGLTGGDRFGVTATADHARLVVTTQAAERIYRSTGGAAEVENALRVGPNGHLAWLPQETILFDGAALTRRLSVDLAEGASFLGLDTLVLGRAAMGEDVTRAALSDHWRIRRGGRLLHAEALRMRGDIAALSGRAATLNGARAVAVLVHVASDAETRLDLARRLLPCEGVAAAASAWGGRLVVRWMAADLHPLKCALARFLDGFPGARVPRVWQI